SHSPSPHHGSSQFPHRYVDLVRFFCQRYGVHRDLHSFPTRRSSDLQTGLPGNWGGSIVALGLAFFAFSTILGWAYYGERSIEYRSEEHTSELQSREKLVCRLLLEKKNEVCAKSCTNP